MARNNDLMTALLDTRRELNDQIGAVGDRVEGAEKELRQVVTAEVESLRDDIRETRARVNNGSSATTEVTRQVTALRQDLHEIRQAVADLHSLVNDLAGHQVFDTSTPWTGPAAAPAAEAEVPAVEPSANGRARETETPASMSTGRTGVLPDGEPDETDQRKQSSEALDSGTEPSEEVSHGALLLGAAPIASIVLVCHRDAWNFVAGLASGQEHFNPTPEITDDGDGRVRIILSGRSLIGVLIALREARVKGSVFDGSWAMASAFYRRMAEDLRKTRRAGKAPLTIVFNDGVTDNYDDGASPEAG
ncbi:hypothetical protein KQY30_32065 [Streptomyces sp. GMY02]|uniref:hypothetical protein n=1 Tax=Streptomyces sp. GMY02 TaxID=1333528 RepID=UPI001C2C3221|nr:hypothetical protein [Streptomyces sp. GMY02]QXE38176.1 hypothetical protein KQY30_32065 [Streptomyces sp. GMY02]